MRITWHSNGLTRGYPEEVARRFELSHEGMAHFAGTGPLGEVCKNCVFYGYRRKYLDKAGNTIRTRFRGNACGKFHQLTGKHGADFPDSTEACRYFEQRNNG